MLCIHLAPCPEPVGTYLAPSKAAFARDWTPTPAYAHIQACALPEAIAKFNALTHAHARFLQVAREAIPALVALKQAGLVKAVGFSGLPLPMFTKLLDLVDPGEPRHKW